MLTDLPEPIAQGVSTFLDAARGAFGDRLKAVVLYGSGAEGRLRPTSDVNLLLVLTSFDAAQAAGLRGPFAAAHAAMRLEAMFLLESEVPQAIESFGQKFSDILRRHRVLYGADPFAGVQVSRPAVIFRLKQVLLNLAVRLRAEYLEHGATPERVASLIADSAGPLRSCAATLRELEGKPPVPPKEALAEFASGLGESGWEATLANITEARDRHPLPAAAADETLLRLSAIAERLRERAGRLQ
jgi:hypothetical protein